jgi:hypothetical protein
MKKLLFCIAIFFVFSINNSYSGNIEKMDSLFAYHIKSLNDTINKYTTSDEQKIWISGDDRIFVEMVDFIADFKFDQQGYTHQPMINRKEVKAIKTWYKKNRKKLNISKIEQYLLLKEEVYNTYKCMNQNDFLNADNAMDKVFNKIDSLKKVNTFIE